MLVLLVLGMVMVVVLEVVVVVVVVLEVVVVVVVVVLEVVVVVTQPSNAGCRYDRPTVYLEWKGKKLIHTFVGKMPFKSTAEGQKLGSNIHFCCKFSLESRRK
jgi:hypothetical protein